ncbi:unnamed protein product [Meloidogyne enterolobii]|uniref:Uncharacterized protein n=1 Tax=Meloidogyne enterolobii TaxID=390850 RepID=A0ACB1AEY6_MELEN
MPKILDTAQKARPGSRAAITAQSHNLLENFWPLSILVPISLAR